ncbi:MAG: hypothetical protein GOV01_02540 [Candidatus Altiarchaeota archaeon]|nr:hypothetical protein [Candidatus Altiarchaeota archaeon]
MEREKILEDNFKEFYSSAVTSFEGGHFTTSYILFFKALVSLADLSIFHKRGIIPRNHKQRFEILNYIDLGLKNDISRFFKEYTKTYSSKMVEEECREIKQVVEKHEKSMGILEEIA